MLYLWNIEHAEKGKQKKPNDSKRRARLHKSSGERLPSTVWASRENERLSVRKSNTRRNWDEKRWSPERGWWSLSYSKVNRNSEWVSICLKPWLPLVSYQPCWLADSVTVALTVYNVRITVCHRMCASDNVTSC